MENNLLVSIIVPVYKVERYLPRCIESILGQTYTNFELILVDDGTPDRSGIICDRYAEKDSRIKVIHKENGGVSSARNAGIDEAKGEWITFIDSDDWVTDDYLDNLLQPLEKHECDLTAGAIEWRHIHVSSSKCPECMIDVERNTSEEILRAINRTEFYGPCLKLFNRDLIKSYGLKFPEGILVTEDAIFVNNYLKYCKKMYLTGKVIYFYNELNTISVTRRSPYFEDLPYWSVKYIQSYGEVLEAFKIDDCSKMREIQKKAFFGYAAVLNSIVNNFNKEVGKEKILRAYDLYKGWLDDEKMVNVLDTERHKHLAVGMQSGDIDFLYGYFLNPQKHKKQRIKKVLRKIVVNFLEKYRDGLKRKRNNMFGTRGYE